MDISLFVLFSSISFLMIIVGSLREHWFSLFVGSVLLIILGVSLIDQGVGVTHAGSYGFESNSSGTLEDVTGMETVTVTYSDLYVTGFGSFYVAIGLYFAISSFLGMRNKELEEDL
jgi:hypothetical protein